MLESATMDFLLGIFLAFLGLSGLLVCIGIFAARVNDDLNRQDSASWQR
jgi:hypothetical protein